MRNIHKVLKLPCPDLEDVIWNMMIRIETIDDLHQTEQVIRRIMNELRSYKILHPRARRKVGRRMQVLQTKLQQVCRKRRDIAAQTPKIDPWAETIQIETTFSYGQQGYETCKHVYGWS